MIRSWSAFSIFALMPFFTGCLLMSTHSNRQVQVQVTERSTRTPVANANIEINYSYDSYGVVYVMRVPDPVFAKTDSQGLAVMPMADFDQSITLKVNEESYPLTKKLVRRGGYPAGGQPEDTGAYIVQLSRPE